MSGTTSEILSTENLGVTIEGVELLSAIDLEIKCGEVVAIVGPNGSGKSTFIKAVTGEQQLSSGSVKFNGKALDAWPARQLAQQLAVLPQKSVLNFPFTGREVVTLARTPHDTGNEVDNSVVEEVMKYIDASYLADRFYPNLSGGEQQRIQLARVLAQIWSESDQPRLLLLDEPSSYFDLAHQQMLLQLIQQLPKRNIAVVVVLHDLNMALACADRVAVFSCGRVEAFGNSEDILSEELIESVFSVSARFVVDANSGRRFLTLPESEAPSV